MKIPKVCAHQTKILFDLVIDKLFLFNYSFYSFTFLIYDFISKSILVRTYLSKYDQCCTWYLADRDRALLFPPFMIFVLLWLLL